MSFLSWWNEPQHGKLILQWKHPDNSISEEVCVDADNLSQAQMLVVGAQPGIPGSFPWNASFLDDTGKYHWWFIVHGVWQF